MIFICGDTHFRSQAPFFEAGESFTKWLHEQPWNSSENTFIHLGDFFHSSSLNGKLMKLAIQFWDGLKCQKYLIHGNHEYSRKLGSALDPFEELGVTVYYEPKEVEIEKKKILVLPYFYPNTERSMNDVYPYLEGRYDLILGHFSDQSLFGEEIILSDKLYGKKILGHVHIHNKGDNFIGVPLCSQATEKEKSRRLIAVYEAGAVDLVIPNFLDFETLDYNSQPLPLNAGEYRIYDIVNAPSIRAAKDKFSDIPIHKVEVLLAEGDAATIEQPGVISTKTLLQEFMERHEYSTPVRDRVLHYLQH